MQKNIILILFLSIGFTNNASELRNSSYGQDCKTVDKVQDVKKIDWIRTQLQEMGYEPTAMEGNRPALLSGERKYHLWLNTASKDCEAVGAMLSFLKNIKIKKTKIEGMTFTFDAEKAEVQKLLGDKIIIKEIQVTEDEVLKKKDFLAHALKTDQDPKKIFVYKEYVQSLNKIKNEIRKVVDEQDVQDLKYKIKQLEMQSKAWLVEQGFKFNEKILKMSDHSVEKINDKVSDLEAHIKLYDDVRRGLWSNALKTKEKIHFPSEKLQTEMAKGKKNIEGILKAIKSDTETIEKQILVAFSENKKMIEAELGGEKANNQTKK